MATINQEAQQNGRRTESVVQTRPPAVTDNQTLNQDTALFKLLGNALAPYWKWTIVATVLMLATAGANVVPPYLLQQAIDGPIANGENGGKRR